MSESQLPSITMTAKALREALNFVNPDENDEDQLETEVTITQRDAFASSDGHEMPAGLYAHITEYPGEGTLGPLGVDLPQAVLVSTPA